MRSNMPVSIVSYMSTETSLNMNAFNDRPAGAAAAAGAERLRFFTWRDMVVTPLIESLLLALAGAGARVAHRAWAAGLFADALVFYGLLCVLTLAALKALRACFPIREGLYGRRGDE